MIQKFTISRDDSIYEAWPDVAMTPSGRLVCVFTECTHHRDRSYSRIVVCDSMDQGRTWSAKRPITGATQGMPYWNGARITQLRDGRLAVLVDKLHAGVETRDPANLENYIVFSHDDGGAWSEPALLPAQGVVPDKLLELESGRWIVACHHHDPGIDKRVERLWYSDDQGASWDGPVTMGRHAELNLCEVSILPVQGRLVGFFRENSGLGWPCYKVISEDDGETWGEPHAFPLPACHRPVAGRLRNGAILITYRFMQGGRGWMGWWTQNFFAALTDEESALALFYREAHTRILPIDFDRSPESDTGYSGWVEFDDGEVYIVNYIVDDAPKAQIRGYSVRKEDFCLART